MRAYLREASLPEGLQGPVTSRIMRDVHIYVWTQSPEEHSGCSALYALPRSQESPSLFEPGVRPALPKAQCRILSLSSVPSAALQLLALCAVSSFTGGCWVSELRSLYLYSKNCHLMSHVFSPKNILSRGIL